MTTNARPIPIPDPESQPYWDAAARHSLELPYCNACARYVFPPRPTCTRCLGELRWVAVSGRGTVYSYATMHESYMRGFAPPYLVAQVELDEQAGLRLTTNLIDCAPDDAHIGMRVEVAFEDRGDGVAVPQFRPASVGGAASSGGAAADGGGA